MFVYFQFLFIFSPGAGPDGKSLPGVCACARAFRHVYNVVP